MNTLNCILLIDDYAADNFLHELVIQELGCADQVVSVQSGEDALAYLKTAENGIFPQPDLIFLDINMPRMNGWEFIDRYGELDTAQQGGHVVMMLTTSLNPDDRARAESCGSIKDLINKPLTTDGLKQVLAQYFPDRFPEFENP